MQKGRPAVGGRRAVCGAARGDDGAVRRGHRPRLPSRARRRQRPPLLCGVEASLGRGRLGAGTAPAGAAAARRAGAAAGRGGRALARDLRGVRHISVLRRRLLGPALFPQAVDCRGGGVGRTAKPLHLRPPRLLAPALSAGHPSRAAEGGRAPSPPRARTNGLRKDVRRTRARELQARRRRLLDERKARRAARRSARPAQARPPSAKATRACDLRS